MEKQAASLTREACTMPRVEVVGVPCQFIQSSHGGRMQHNALLEKQVLITSLLVFECRRCGEWFAFSYQMIEELHEL